MPRLALLLLFASLSFPIAAEEVFDPETWTPTFVDEFDGDRLDYERWTPKDPWGVVRNEELQAYILKAFHLEEGFLKIRCEDIPAFYDGAKRDYRSGMMTTTGKFSQQYGRFEIRCKVPRGKGLWPAFWLLPEPPAWPPEIDVLEILGHEPDKVYFTHHWPAPANPNEESLSVTGEFQGPDFSADFHTFAVQWEKGLLRWFVDGVERHRSTREVPDEPMFLLVNLAVGGWAEAPEAGTSFPADFEIDFIKVWENRN